MEKGNLAVVLGLGLFVGAGGMALLRLGTSAEAGENVVLAADVSNLAASVSRLEVVVKELDWAVRASSVGVAAPATESNREQVRSEPPADSGQLAQAMLRLAEALESFSVKLDKSSKAIGPLELNTAAVSNASLLEMAEVPEERLKLTHFGWTPQMVLDRYGAPSDIGPSPSGGGVKWYYFNATGPDFIFWFIDGSVASVMK
ncbi:MAG: hypothetical protein HUU28_08375 [Planctomycetaceae bacterium]|nr:hypothetical protein [Planctomycetaceae bacterium]